MAVGDKDYATGTAAGAATPPAGAIVDTISIVTKAGGGGATVAIFGGAAVVVPAGLPFTEVGDGGLVGDGTKQVVFAGGAGDILSWYVSWRKF